jgi:predicted RNase H-like HicB family nuclease
MVDIVMVVSDERTEVAMKTFTAVIEKCPDTGLFVGYIPGIPGAHSQGATRKELDANLKEVLQMLLEDKARHTKSK